MGSAERHTRLFEPLTVGSMHLSNRIAMAPLTRYRAHDNNVIMPMAAEHYSQRAIAYPGTLSISEAVVISPKAGGYRNVPGIWSQEQVSAWKRATSKVHEAGSGAFIDVLTEEGVGDYVSSSATPVELDGPVPRALSQDEILAYIQDFAAAARNAIEAGFDGVEIDAANGFLIDQFTQPTCNDRTDSWGGNIKKRSRFAIEITKAVSDAIGAERTGVRLSPWYIFQGMGMADPLPQFGYLISHLQDLDLAYLHLVKPRVHADRVTSPLSWFPPSEITLLLNLWPKTSPILLAGGFDPKSARRAVDGEYPDRNIVVVFGRYFTSNPDLVWRMRHGGPLRKYDRATFYTPK